MTGERAELASSAVTIGSDSSAIADLPVLVGVGVSTPEQAVEVCEEADGVVVGSAIVRQMIEVGTVDVVAKLVAEFRTALDAR